MGRRGRRLVILLAAAVCCQAEAQQVSVAPYYGGRLAALSLTFDDGLQDQYTLAYPELKRRGLRATFAIIGSKVGGTMRSKQDRDEGTDGTPCMTWDMLREMAADGQEIASHGWAHRAVTRLTAEELNRELYRNDSVIEAETGQRPATFVYPGNNKSAEATARCEKGRIGSRTFQISFGGKRSLAYMRNYVDHLIARGGWGVTMTHGIARGYDHFKDQHIFPAFLDDIGSKQDVLWIAPLRDVMAYVKERDHAQLLVETADSVLLVSIVTDLDRQLFRHPLTLMLSESIVGAEQDGIPLPVISRDGTCYVNIDPHGGRVMLRMKM